MDDNREHLTEEEFKEIQSKVSTKTSLIYPALIGIAVVIGVATEVNLVLPTLLLLATVYIIRRVIKK